jgi:hypothetical protein
VVEKAVVTVLDIALSLLFEDPSTEVAPRVLSLLCDPSSTTGIRLLDDDKFSLE